MDKKLQTEEWFSMLRKKAIKYTRIYAEKYYKQYKTKHEMIEDLADEFITDLLTPTDGKYHDKPMESWVDRYDPSMNLDTCLKVIISRKLIDKTRTDHKRMYSLDSYMEEKGESFYDLDGLISKKFEFKDKNIAESAVRFDRLGPKSKQVLINEYFTVREDLSVDGKHFFDSVFGIKPMSVRIFNTDHSEVESRSVYVNGYDVKISNNCDLKKCFVNSINPNSIIVCIGDSLVPFDKDSGIDKIAGTMSIASQDLIKCSDIRKWKYTYVPEEDFSTFCKTL